MNCKFPLPAGRGVVYEARINDGVVATFTTVYKSPWIPLLFQSCYIILKLAKGDEERGKKGRRPDPSTDRTKRLFYEDKNKGLYVAKSMELRAGSQELRARSQALCPLPFAPCSLLSALCSPLFFLKHHLAVVNRFSHCHAVEIHTADDGFGSEPGFVAYTAFNWLFEDGFYQTSGHVVQINTAINRLGINKLKTQLIGERIRFFLLFIEIMSSNRDNMNLIFWNEHICKKTQTTMNKPNVSSIGW